MLRLITWSKLHSRSKTRTGTSLQAQTGRGGGDGAIVPIHTRVCHLKQILWILCGKVAHWLQMKGYADIFLPKNKIRPAQSILESAQMHGGQKIKMLKFYQMGVYNMQNDERIPNLAQNSNTITFEPSFGQKKTVESWDFLGIFSKIPRFDSFLAKMEAKCYPI